MVFPEGSFPYLDEELFPSQGRAVWETELAGVGRFIDPDLVFRRWYPDGSSETFQYPEISSLRALSALNYDFDVERIRDSFGRFVGTGALSYPEEGTSITTIHGWQVNTFPYAGRAETFSGSPGYELVERVLFLNRDGSIREQEWSFGRGRPYDPSHHGGGFMREGMAAAGIRRPFGERLTQAEYNQVQAAVLSREYLLREAV